ncbi:Uncharacterised protein [Mycobacteroides abscessus subsp. abscessus]|nr:Uncharacterised protein [Mycobacteroides abscessus subsp. abscessus]
MLPILVDFVVPPDIWMHRAPLNGAGPDQCHLHHQVIETLGFQPGQRGHLSPRLHLKHSHRIGAGQHLVNRLLLQIDMSQVDIDALVLANQIDAIVQRRKHAKPEKIELHQTHCRTIVFVPLQHTAVFHARPFDGHHIGQRPIADDHATGVDAHVTRKILDLPRQLNHLRRDTVNRRGIGQATPVAHLFTPGILLPLREPQRLGHVPHGHATTVCDHVGHLSRILTAILVVDVLDGLFPFVRFDIDIDIRRPVTGRRQEPFEQQTIVHRVHIGDPERIADRRVGGRTTALTQDIAAATELRDVMHHQEIARKIQLRNDFQLTLDLGIGLLRTRPGTVSARGTLKGQMPQPTVLGVAGRDVERRQLWGNEPQIEGALLPQLGGRRHHLRIVRKQSRHLITGTQMSPAHRIQPARGVIKALTRPHRRHRHGQAPALGRREMCCRGGDNADTEAPGQRGQLRVAFVFARVTVSVELYADAIGTESVHQIGQRPLRSNRTAARECPSHVTLTAPGQDVPVPSGRLGECIKVIAWLALPVFGRSTRQMRAGHLPRQPPIPLLATSQYQQMYRILGIALPPKR